MDFPNFFILTTEQMFAKTNVRSHYIHFTTLHKNEK
nr:MAG TPA: hypothetical protein [Caudoviricetes sp.]